MGSGLYLHQQRVNDLILAGKNVLLTAPTGSGKTRAALHPFLWALDHEEYLPSKCIYSVPMRILANQFIREYKEIVQEYGLAIGRPHLRTTIQTGEQQDDREFASNLIFATIDQTLSSYLLTPYSLPKRLGNINAGALVGAYLVFDEFHLYDPNSTLPTTLHMLKQLNSITPFVLMTATFSTSLVEELARELNCEIVPKTEEERQAIRGIQSQQKTRRYYVADTPLNAERVLEKHRGRSIVICNQVERTQQLYRRLNALKSDHTRLILLHSQFLTEDRRRIETLLQETFARDSGVDVIVVATQAIEVGVDISSTVMHTELAPANSIVQRAGRCARYQGDEGDVYIYHQAEADDGSVIDLTRNIMPYKDMEDVIGKTLTAFQARSRNTFTYLDEQAVLDEAHTEEDTALLQRLRSVQTDQRRKIHALQSGNPNQGGGTVDPRHLIREIASQPVTISSNPDSLLDAPFDASAFGLHPGTVQKHLKAWLDRKDELGLDWAIKMLVEKEDEGQTQVNQERFVWQPVTDAKSAWGAQLLVVNPILASYDPDFGFIAQREDEKMWEAQLPSREARLVHRPIRYRLETYAIHIELVHQAFDELWEEIAGNAGQLEKYFGWQPRTLRRACELAVLLHDVGKLSKGWQKWVQDYQRKIDQPADMNRAYAHTDYDSANEDHRTAQQQMGKRPYHAVESALATLPVVHQILADDYLMQAVFSAIARHHAPFSQENMTARLTGNAPKFISETFAETTLTIDTSALNGLNEDLTPLDDADRDSLIAMPDSPQAFLPYLLIARVLRRADQEGTRMGA
ncbi:MAG: CRISPR-associated helicase Cas3' [Chloroflexi bacterium]|nr:CRISPR-associated helicase Cas3' [Chloroflexota bacterium]